MFKFNKTTDELGYHQHFTVRFSILSSYKLPSISGRLGLGTFTDMLTYLTIYYKKQRTNSRRIDKETSSIKQRTSKVYSTATELVWCDLSKLQTDSIAWNRFMRLSNGNGTGKAKVKVKAFLDIMYQNLPCTLATSTVGTQLETLVTRYKPDILFLGEADGEDVKAGCPEGYAWVGGSLKSKKNLIRVSAIVNDKIPFKTFNIKTKVPAVGIKVGEWKIVGVYREWALEGDQSTKSREQQIDRLQDFVSYWLTLKGKTCCLGDFNFDPLPETDYQKQLEPIRTCVNDVVLPVGWYQMGVEQK